MTLTNGIQAPTVGRTDVAPTVSIWETPAGESRCMRYAITHEPVDHDDHSRTAVSVLTLLDDAHGCEKLAQRLVVIPSGSTHARVEPDDDELVYLLVGDGVVEVDGRRVVAPHGSGLFVARGTEWSLSTESGVELVSVLVHAPVAAEVDHAVVDLVAEGRHGATAARTFTLGVGPAVGCRSATQFLGHVPPGRAPDHFHRYDEVIYVLAGTGVLHIDGEETPLGAGACVHLPAGVVHCLENSGATELTLLGVFTPAGSPAEAYYPDGTPAQVPEQG
jgi:mannose-6-phosphate isomerase-like protein (cupin superfamily)